MRTQTVYQFDSSGYYQGETTADESPLEPGTYLHPARTTPLKPDTPTPGSWPRWNGAHWVMVNLPAALKTPDPLTKLQAFLDSNPDVKALLS